MTLVGYFALVAGLWAFFGVIADSTAQAKLGLHLSPIVWIALTLTVVTVMSYRGVDVSLRVMGILVSLEVVALLVMDIAILVSGGDAGVSLDGFQLSAIASPGFGLAFLFIVTNFTGFEATVVFSEEARDPRIVYSASGVHRHRRDRPVLRAHGMGALDRLGPSQCAGRGRAGPRKLRLHHG